MSDTPRTDDQVGWDGSTNSFVHIEFVRGMERELNAAKEKIASLEADLRSELSGVEPEEQSDELATSSKN